MEKAAADVGKKMHGEAESEDEDAGYMIVYRGIAEMDA